MASIATTTNPTSCSSLFNNKISKTTRPKQPFVISTTTTTAKLVSFKVKPISLNTPLFPSLSLLRFRLSSASFDGFELKDESFSSEEQDPETESPQDEQQEESKELRSDANNNNGGGDSDSGRLYVGNLPYSMNSSQLAQVFAEAGSVVTVEVIYDKVTDRSRGFAFVTMASVEEAQEAIRLFDGSEVGGRTVKVNFPQVPRGGEREVMGPKMRDANKGYVDSPHKIYAGNLSWRLTSVELREAFAGQPGMLSAKVIYERDTGRSRGFGFVSFETPEAARVALDAMDGVELEGRPLRLNLAAERASPPRAQDVESEGVDGSELLASVNT